MEDTQFSLELYEQCFRSLATGSRQGWKIASPNDRITSEWIARGGPFAFDDFLVGHLPSQHATYVTQHSAVFSRCPLPYHGDLFWAEGEGGLVHQLSWVLGLARLGGIGQLSLLSLPVRHNYLTIGFNHNRLTHTMDVYVLGLLCAHNLQIYGADRWALRIALAIHDLFTPVCGDLMKFIDAAMYDEDDKLTSLLNNEDYLHLCESIKVAPEEPIRIAQHKDDLLCQVRDFVDTLGYVTRDLYEFQGKYNADLPSLYYSEDDKILEQQLRKLEQQSCWLNLWEHVERGEHGDLVFSDHGKLRDFLFARACLFRLLYYHYQTRNLEYVLGIRFVETLLEEGFFTKEQFCVLEADELIWWPLYQRTGYNPSFLHNAKVGETHFFTTERAALEYVQEWVAPQDHVCAVMYRWPSATKSKVNAWSVVHDGVEKPWGEAYPEQAAEIEAVMQLPQGVFVGVCQRHEMHQVKPKYWRKLKDVESRII